MQRGETVWVDVPNGRLKTEVFESPQLGEQPTLLVLGHHPELADAAILASCPCDLPAWRKHMKAEQQNPIREVPIRGLSPLDFAANVGPSTFVHLLVGSDDRVALREYSEAYARALREQNVDVRMTVLPGLGHEIFLEDLVIDATVESVRNLER